MCNFITATLPEGADTAEFRAAVAAAGLRFAPLVNPAMQARLLPKEAYFHATRAQCDCSSGLRGPPPPPRLDEQVKKLRAKGWSEAKVAAWLRTQGPRPEEATGRAVRRGELAYEAWLSFLRAALSLRGARYVGLLQHHYRSSTDDEDFVIARERRTLTELAARAIPWEDDVLYEIVPG